MYKKVFNILFSVKLKKKNFMCGLNLVEFVFLIFL